eukprot:1393699-Amorphochlora_amoeboformis.AAC.1
MSFANKAVAFSLLGADETVGSRELNRDLAFDIRAFSFSESLDILRLLPFLESFDGRTALLACWSGGLYALGITTARHSRPFTSNVWIPLILRQW